MYPKIMVKFMPTGLLGLLIAVFLAAYMSTIASQINWGTSYLINDFYRRFIKKNASEKHYVLVSRFGIVLMIIFSLLVTRYFLSTISGAWEFIINASAGMGSVLILRWFWWRINAWSEISAMIVPLIIYPIARFGFSMESPITLYPIVLGTTIVWLLVTFITKPVEQDKLLSFYKKTHPGGVGWRKVSILMRDVKGDSDFKYLFLNWFLGVIVIYAVLFGIGKVLFAEYLMGITALCTGIAAISIILYNIQKRGFKAE
jgi:SSS family solute:Na+ symporter